MTTAPTGAPRLGLTYAEGECPATVFVKGIDPDHRELIKLTSGPYHEPRLFDAGVRLPLETPVVYASIIDEDAEDFLMVMEDLTARDADPRDATRPLTVEQAASGLRGLARMHAMYWGERISGRTEMSWVEPFEPFDGLEWAPLPAAQERLAADTPPEVLALSIGELVNDI